MPNTPKRKLVSRRWPAHLTQRLRQLRRKMAQKKLPALLVSHPVDIRYLTGFSGEDSCAIVTKNAVTILSDRRFEEELAVGCPYARVVMRTNAMSDAVERVVKAHKLKRLGVQAEHLTLTTRGALSKRIGSVLQPVTGWIIEQRAVKDDAEVATIQKAIDVQERAFTATLGQTRPGMTERHIAAILEFEMRRGGADGPSFDTIIAAGANGSVPHYRAADVKLKNNSSLLIDWGARVGGYCGDLTRTVFFGKPPRKIVEIYRIVRDAQLAGIEAIAPGKSVKEVDAAARKVIDDAGYGKQFGHGLGHGIGLEIHELPSLSFRSEAVLQEGQVVTVEPGIYLPGVGGVRIEDDILVTARGGRKLSSLPTDLESAMI